MFNIERWKEIFQSIQKNKLRTALSGMTVSLGILIFIILFGLGEGLKNSYSDLFLNNANNVIYIYPGKTTKPYGGFKTNRRIELKNADIDALKQEFSSSIEYVNPSLFVSEPISYGLESFTFEISAVSPSNQLIEKHVLMKGRYINEKDIKEKNKKILSELNLEFTSKELAIEYAKKNKIEIEIIEPKKRKIVKKSYADNFLK